MGAFSVAAWIVRRDPVHPFLFARLSLRRLPGADGRAGDLAPRGAPDARRIEASVPLTLNEIQADKDKLRAEFAMSTRRLEMSIKGFARRRRPDHRDQPQPRRTEAARGRARREARRTVELEAQGAELRAELRQREDQLQRESRELWRGRARRWRRRRWSWRRSARLYDDATFAASGRQIELVARESEIEKLNDDLSRVQGPARIRPPLQRAR
jgi:hypothetical protein